MDFILKMIESVKTLGNSHEKLSQFDESVDDKSFGKSWKGNVETEWSKTKRKSFEPPKKKPTKKCPNHLKPVYNKSDDSELIFCNKSGNLDEIDTDESSCNMIPEEISEIDIGRDTPVCNTYPCPEGYSIYGEDKGGFCANMQTREVCALNPDKTLGFPYCNERDDYIKYEGYDIKDMSGNDSLILKQGSRNFYTEEECAEYCDQRSDCKLFTHTNSGPEKGKCILKNGMNGENINIIKNNKIDTYLKTPFNYNIYGDTNVIGNNIPDGFSNNTTIEECAELCNSNNECDSFVIGMKSAMGKCWLKSHTKPDLKFDSSKITFEKRKNYTLDVKNKPSGLLCANPTEDIKKTIQNKRNQWIENHEIKEKQQKDDNEKNRKIIEKKTYFKAKKKATKMMIRPDTIIAWSNISTRCKTIRIELLEKNYLHFTNLQVFGRVGITSEYKDWIKEKNTKITHSPLLNNEKYNELMKSDNLLDINNENKTNPSNTLDKCFNDDIKSWCCFDTNKNLFPYIEIKFIEEIEINKIIIFNRLDKFKARLTPMKISLFNNDNFLIKFAIKKNFETPLKISKDLPKPPGNILYSDSGITDYGLNDYYRGWQDVTNSGRNNDFCRVTQTNEGNILSCATEADQTSQYSFNSKSNINLGYPNTAYMKDETNNGRDDFCRCIGKHPYTYVSCIPATETGFNTDIDEFVPIRKPRNCEHLTGEILKKAGNINDKPLCIDSEQYRKEIKNRVDTGFYWNKNDKYYLFKNTILNNNEIVLYNVIDRESHQIMSGYPKIVNKYTWNNLSFTNKIDATLYAGDDILYIFSGDKYIKFNMITRKQYPNYPKKIRNNWMGLPFYKNLSAACYLGDGLCMIFKDNYFIEYDLKMSEKPRISLDIRKINKESFPELTFNRIDAIISFYNQIENISIIYRGNRFVNYNISDKQLIALKGYSKSSSLLISSRYINIWNININVF